MEISSKPFVKDGANGVVDTEAKSLEEPIAVVNRVKLCSIVGGDSEVFGSFLDVLDFNNKGLVKDESKVRETVGIVFARRSDLWETFDSSFAGKSHSSSVVINPCSSGDSETYAEKRKRDNSQKDEDEEDEQQGKSKKSGNRLDEFAVMSSCANDVGISGLSEESSDHNQEKENNSTSRADLLVLCEAVLPEKSPRSDLHDPASNDDCLVREQEQAQGETKRNTGNFDVADGRDPEPDIVKEDSKEKQKEDEDEEKKEKDISSGDDQEMNDDERGDLVTPSYRLHKGYRPSDESDLLSQVLNDQCAIEKPEFIAKAKKRSKYEKFMIAFEDDRYEADMLFHRLKLATQHATTLLAEIEKQQPTPVPIETHLTSHDLRCIEQIYHEHGLDMIRALRSKPSLALPVILSRLNQKAKDCENLLANILRVRV